MLSLECLEDRCCPSAIGPDAPITFGQFAQQYQQAIQNVLLPAEGTLIPLAQQLSAAQQQQFMAGIVTANNLFLNLIPAVQPLFAQTGQTTLGQLGQAEGSYFVNVLLPGIENISF